MKKRVLLADDTLFFRVALTDLLQAEGWEVVQVGDGREAQERALEELPDLDLLILDVEMPEMDGLQALEVVRGRPEGREVPAVILSGNPVGPQRQEQLERLGVRLALEKSAPLPELAARIVAALKGE
jgi:CheY-like chemotaxis protein